MKRKPLVYVSSPFTRGDQLLNVRFQCEMFYALVTENEVTPITPLWSGLQHLVIPQKYDFWMDYDKEVILRCDAMVRLDAKHIWDDGTEYFQRDSTGCDIEEQHCRDNGIPVFYSIRDLYAWVKEDWTKE
jgi:hypothetical protein